MEAGDRLCLHSPGPERTRVMGSCLARAWRASCFPDGVSSALRGRECLVISLVGALGVGKTVFVKGLARGVEIAEEAVSSPTFVLANQYASPVDGVVLHHVDFYRLEAIEELETMGFYDLMARDCLLAVEWGARFSEALPLDRIEVVIEMDPGGEPDARIFRIQGTGPQSVDLMRAWEDEMAGEGISAVSGADRDIRI